MPYEPHANLIQPEYNNAYIWRFIDLPKFLDTQARRDPSRAVGDPRGPV